MHQYSNFRAYFRQLANRHNVCELFVWSEYDGADLLLH